ncbi:hypothetical protein [Endozoicomonas sp. ALB091]|uniref:hypothetical protein n=1 Tax=Endozoicomonas sp. ALB091 TaxID=3403073 RepID=UPI003BB48D26
MAKAYREDPQTSSFTLVKSAGYVPDQLRRATGPTDPPWSNSWPTTPALESRDIKADLLALARHCPATAIHQGSQDPYPVPHDVVNQLATYIVAAAPGHSSVSWHGDWVLIFGWSGKNAGLTGTCAQP